MNDLGTISGAALNQYLVSARAAGVDPSKGLLHSGIAPTLADDPEARIPGEQFEKLLIWLIETSGDPLFGLHTSQYVQPGSYSVMGYIAMSASTLFEALSKVALYEKLVGDMGVTETLVNEGLVEVRWICRHQKQPARRHLIENVLGSWVLYSRWLTDNSGLSPELVMLEHGAPEDRRLREDYRRIFGCEVRFDQPCSAIISSPMSLQHRLRQPDPQLHSTLEAHAARKLQSLGIETTLTQKVRNRILSSLTERLPRKEQVAEDLGLNVRTLHRRLQDEGTSWQDILDNLRQELARTYLRDTPMAQTEIAERLGYSDIRSFQRSFKRHHQMTPGEYRDQNKSLPSSENLSDKSG
ncbi:MAG: AraC family transcriptional regulator [Alcanivoracaceae bacterium]|nr:AraC family transcriptional regulator [Alcanivoracaceae bacterium]